jgi:hypothetical protein
MITLLATVVLAGTLVAPTAAGTRDGLEAGARLAWVLAALLTPVLVWLVHRHLHLKLRARPPARNHRDSR